jgi:hypothetical protein
MAQLVTDVLLLVFTELQDDPASLHSCILVNRIWCCMAMPILWKYVSYAYFKQKRESREKLHNVIISNYSGDVLRKKNILLHSHELPKIPMFEYINFFTHIAPNWIKEMVQLSIDDEIMDYMNKTKFLEDEIYKIILTRCKNVKYFHWYTNKKLYKYPGAKSFFSNLISLGVSFEHKVVTSQIFRELTTICQNLKNLEINYCHKDSKDLVSFIEAQRNLQSLYLHFSDVKKRYPLLSEVIMRKATTLKKFILSPLVSFVDYEFLSSLINLKHLEIDNDSYGNANWSQWEKCLVKASFPNIQYFEALFLPINVESSIIEKSGGNILEINLSCSFKFQNYSAENLQLIRIIS